MDGTVHDLVVKDEGHRHLGVAHVVAVCTAALRWRSGVCCGASLKGQRSRAVRRVVSGRRSIGYVKTHGAKVTASLQQRWTADYAYQTGAVVHRRSGSANTLTSHACMIPAQKGTLPSRGTAWGQRYRGLTVPHASTQPIAHLPLWAKCRDIIACHRMEQCRDGRRHPPHISRCMPCASAVGQVRPGSIVEAAYRTCRAFSNGDDKR